MKQLLTKLLKDKTFRIIMILRFKIYFIQLLLISFGSTNTNMFFVLVFFLNRTSELLNKTPLPMSGFVRISATPLPLSPRTSFVNDPLPVFVRHGNFCFFLFSNNKSYKIPPTTYSNSITVSFKTQNIDKKIFIPTSLALNKLTKSLVL